MSNASAAASSMNLLFCRIGRAPGPPRSCRHGRAVRPQHRQTLPEHPRSPRLLDLAPGRPPSTVDGHQDLAGGHDEVPCPITESDCLLGTLRYGSAALPNLPFRSEACPHIGGEHRFTIMKGATPTFMPDCDVVVIRGLVWEEA